MVNEDGILKLKKAERILLCPHFAYFKCAAQFVFFSTPYGGRVGGFI